MNRLSKNSQSGHILLISIVFFAIMLTMSGALLGYVSLHVRTERQTIAGAQALHLAEAAAEKAVYQLNLDPAYSGESDTPLGNGTFTISVSSIDNDTKRITATGYIPNSANPVAVKAIKITAAINASVISFRYGIQAGDGGFTLSNSSSIVGNVSSSGPIVGSGNMIYGDVISSEAGGWVYGIHATGSVYSHLIGRAGATTIVDKNAYYQSLTNTTVGGTKYAGNPDQPSAPLPISDAQISQWESFAEAGGTITNCDSSGNYNITSSVSLGPVKIACNLVIKSSSAVVKVTGPIWVTGNITTQTGPTIRIDPALGNQNVAIIADSPYNRAGSGVITIGQSTQFFGSGSPNSFVFLISQNNSAETGGSAYAVSLNQGAAALVAYASHGLINLSQSVDVKEVTAYKIALSQSAKVTYDTGLPNTLFESGPGGSWSYTPGTYVIVK